LLRSFAHPDTLPSGTRATGSRSALAVSGFRLRARLGFSIHVCSPGQRGVTPAFGYSAPGDFNPHDSRAAQRTLRARPTPRLFPDRLRFWLAVAVRDRLSDCGPDEVSQVPTRSLRACGVFDHGRASTPRIAAPHILPSATVTASASTDFGFSRLNSPPHAIAVYASRRSSPSAPQPSLPSARYGLLGPDFHRLDHASFAWRTTVTVMRDD
jgi:hypothetical protein